MKLLKNLKVYLILITIIIIGILLILNEFLLYGLVLFGVVILIFSFWKLFLKNKQEEISKLNEQLSEEKKQNDFLLEENKELKNRKLNISEIKNILDLGLIEVDTNFIRTWNNSTNHGNKKVHFIGALQVNIIAKYGIDLKELRIKFDKEENTISVANINPKFLSFKDLDYDWKISEIMEYKQVWFGSGHWRKSIELEGFAAKIKEDLRKTIHQEVINGPNELKWVLEPLRKQIENSLEIIIGSVPGRKIRIVNKFDETYLPLDQYSETD
ncbi:hypothetical protein VOI54_03250 [Tamlana sp. 2201CG12-4]|uniref:hypothetical protein n=1 Tax=Tamlana sp. 2201CG12-4 TaxID=3112582 RepID=UPI002DB5E8A4|nr:hypothetical protein [Tamlana sp. 2201CG12-4]MEC3906017.1 hypothetical protein [Tamlana sp. 2201CG12-4]